MSLLETIQEHAQGLSSIKEIPGYISEELEDAREVLFGGFQWNLEAYAMDPIRIGNIAIDLSPTRQLVFMVLAALLSIALFVPMARAARRRDPSKAPSGFFNAMEAMILYFRDEVVRSTIGRGADAYTPFILTIFFFILFMNLFGLTPFAVTATGNLSVTAALAVVSFVVIEVSGMRALGPAGYARTIFYLPEGLPTFMKPVMLAVLTPIELLGKLAKPFALAIRLFANMMGGHILVLSLLGMILVLESYIMGVGIVIALGLLMLLELFVAFLQAYIFAMLTAVFIGLIRQAH
jgi:F-type H+-transporting ATPase subunit a